MEYLLDTHTFIWFINGDASLPLKVKKEIVNIENKCFLSIGSVWEISIKLKLNKLSLGVPFNNVALFLSENEIELLPIAFTHLEHLLTLEMPHRDPFDRLIISQAIAENLTLISKDEHFKNYPVKWIWN